MKIIFVCIENFQEYIIDNIKNLQLFDNRDITVITNRRYFDRLKQYNIDLYAIEDLDDLGFNQNNRLDRLFRNGFWMHCSARFFYLYSYIRKFNIQNIIHLENDVMAYINFDKLLPHFKTNKVYAAFDCETRVIPGLLYIPNYTSFCPIIENYNYNMNDMENLARFDENIIEPLPIIPHGHIENKKYCKNFIDCIYDTAALGQYLGGVDKRNMDGDTRGYVNETCVIKYDKYGFFWKKIDGLYVPHLWIDGNYVRIVNLHLHGKELFKFMADNPLETKYIPIL